MDSNRSAKRRKLDIPQHGSQQSSPASRSKATPIKFSQREPEGSHDRSKDKRLPSKSPATINGVKGSFKPSEAWLEAKAKSQARLGKRPDITPSKERGTDVYDDFEGAHAHQSPLMKTRTPTSLPARKQLDPLRNQKPGSTSSSSPAKAGATLGFFKQFHEPRTEAATPVQKEKPVSGANGHGSRQIGDDADAGVEESGSSDDEDDEPAQGTPIRSSGKGLWKGWAYEDKPKKTFEDEIKELANTAREQARNDEDDSATPRLSEKRSGRVSSSTPNRNALQESKTETRPKVTPTPKRVKPMDRRRDNRVDHAEAAVDQDDWPEDRMQVDHSEDENAPTANIEQTNGKAGQSITHNKARPQQYAKAADTRHDLNFSSDHLCLIQTILLEKLIGKRPTRLTNLDDEYAKVSNLVSQTITAGESNSMLLIGARGSGKTVLVSQILREQTAERPEDFHVVRLNGFIHTDDKIALREIWRQLGREMELDEEESTSKNYADTLTTLLALLSHPAEQGRDQPDHITKSVVFILDEFELFASHPRQTLLYNLFDIAQSRKAPIAVLGLTTRVDVAESLEKRVKSRFSHRYVHLSSAKSFTAFQEACKTAITIHRDDLSVEEREQLSASSEIPAKLEKVSKKQNKSAYLEWNSFIELLLSNEVFTNHLRRLYYTTKSVPGFRTSMLMSIATIPFDRKTSTTDLLEHITTNTSISSLSQPDSKLDLLSSLSTLQLALLICAARLHAIHNSDIVPFAQAYEEYKVLASKAKLHASASGSLAQGRIWSKDVARGAWETLVGCGLLMEGGSRGCRVDVGLEEIGMSGVELGSWGRWCREI